MNVGDWLRNIGLGQYEAAFRENEIESEVPPNLTAEDLKELGVAILGHRRNMLAATMELSGSSAAPATLTMPPPPSRHHKGWAATQTSSQAGGA
jgi:SAM (Sterile alpha motif) domain-containing protein